MSVEDRIINEMNEEISMWEDDPSYGSLQAVGYEVDPKQREQELQYPEGEKRWLGRGRTTKYRPYMDPQYPDKGEYSSLREALINLSRRTDYIFRDQPGHTRLHSDEYKDWDEMDRGERLAAAHRTGYILHQHDPIPKAMQDMWSSGVHPELQALMTEENLSIEEAYEVLTEKYSKHFSQFTRHGDRRDVVDLKKGKKMAHDYLAPWESSPDWVREDRIIAMEDAIKGGHIKGKTRRPVMQAITDALVTGTLPLRIGGKALGSVQAGIGNILRGGYEGLYDKVTEIGDNIQERITSSYYPEFQEGGERDITDIVKAREYYSPTRDERIPNVHRREQMDHRNIHYDAIEDASAFYGRELDPDNRDDRELAKKHARRKYGSPDDRLWYSDTDRPVTDLVQEVLTEGEDEAFIPVPSDVREARNRPINKLMDYLKRR